MIQSWKKVDFEKLEKVGKKVGEKLGTCWKQVKKKIEKIEKSWKKVGKKLDISVWIK